MLMIGAICDPCKGRVATVEPILNCTKCGRIVLRPNYIDMRIDCLTTHGLGK